MDTFSKSEGYRSFLQDAAVPFTPICCFVIYTILKYYNNITGIYGTFFTYVFFILFLLASVNIAIRYKKNFNNLKFITFSVIILTLVCSIISFFLKNKINNLTSSGNLPEYIENIPVVIDDINLKRYSSEIYFHAAIDTYQEFKGIIYYQGDDDLKKNDEIFLHKKIYKIILNKNPFNNYLLSRGFHFAASLQESDITVLKKMILLHVLICKINF